MNMSTFRKVRQKICRHDLGEPVHVFLSSYGMGLETFESFECCKCGIKLCRLRSNYMNRNNYDELTNEKWQQLNGAAEASAKVDPGLWPCIGAKWATQRRQL